MTKDSKTAIRGSGRVGFLARMDGIKKMIDAGHPLLFIYKEHEKHLSISYSQFVKYVHKFIRSKSTEDKSAKPKPKSKGKELSPAELLQLPNDEKDAF